MLSPNYSLLISGSLQLTSSARFQPGHAPRSSQITSRKVREQKIGTKLQRIGVLIQEGGQNLHP